MALQAIAHKVMGPLSAFYKRQVAYELSRYGLRYEDLLIDQEPHVAEALALADPAVIQGRNRRVLRAFDLDLKKKNFTDYAPDVDQETFKTEIYDDITKIRERDAEYALINMHKK